MEEKYILKLNSLTKSYNKKSPPALEGVDLAISSGRIVGLLGPNGSGKTTLIKIANGLLTADSGELLIDGMAPCPETKSIVSYLPDREFLPQWMTVEKALAYYGDFFPDFRRDLADAMLDDLKVSKKSKIKTLSKGNREKVMLIVAMCRAAKLYLLDEPLAGVDPAARSYILDTIVSKHTPESTVVISTHLIADVEEVLDDVIFLKNGVVELFGDAEEIRQRECKSIDALFREVFKW